MQKLLINMLLITEKKLEAYINKKIGFPKSEILQDKFIKEIYLESILFRINQEYNELVNEKDEYNKKIEAIDVLLYVALFTLNYYDDKADNISEFINEFDTSTLIVDNLSYTKKFTNSVYCDIKNNFHRLDKDTTKNDKIVLLKISQVCMDIFKNIFNDDGHEFIKYLSIKEQIVMKRLDK